MLRSYKSLFVSLGLLLCLGVAVRPAQADEVTTTKHVSFRPGTSSKTLTGSLKGYDSVRYEVEAKQGQKMSVKLTSKNTFLYFNVLNKRTDLALETEPAPREVTQWSGTLPESGTYVVVVYFVRAEARRGRRANYSLSLSLRSSSASPTTKLDYESGGSGEYFVSNGGDKHEVSKVRVILKPGGNAELQVDLSGDGFILNGRWTRSANNKVRVEITRGFANDPLKGAGVITLRGSREFEKLDVNFLFPKQKTRHHLTFQAAKG